MQPSAFMVLGFFMLHKIFIWLFLFCFPFIAKGQEVNNLVPNGNFEEIDSCFNQIPGLWKVNNWSAAVPINACSSDYFNKCQLAQPWLPKEPIQKTLGKGSAAILLKTTVQNHREYLQNKLLTKLEHDTIYELRLKLRPIYNPYQTEWGTDRIEILFSYTAMKANVVNNFTPSNIDTCPSVVFKDTYLDTNEWYECKGLYKAIGGEEHLTIGIFSADSVFDFYPIGDTLRQQWKAAYYLIDDVMVYKASDTIKKQPEPILPNVFSPNGDGANEVYKIENLPEGSTLEVFNRWGSLVFKQTPYQNNWPGNNPNGNPLADGVYFAILTYQDPSGKLQQKKQTVHVVR